MRMALLLYLARAGLAGSIAPTSSVVPVSEQVSTSAAPAILQPYMSYSIEFCYFPDYAGNRSQPNTFSNQLLDNLGDIQGIKPYIRVGGNTQDYALYNASLEYAVNGTVVPSKSVDYPYIIYIGPSFFESYSTWPNTRFIHGFNLAKNDSKSLQSLLDTVPLACRALQDGKLAYWELGNEPDLYKTSSQGVVRPANWTEQDYVDEWLTKSRDIRHALAEACPELATESNYKYIAPSFAGISNSLKPIATWKDGLNSDHNIALNSEHNYVGGATSPGVTLQVTLMNHTRVVQNVNALVNLSRVLAEDGLTEDIPFVLGEHNSLYNEGAPGLSNAFGAALWGVDFNLYAASQGIRRQHMHQGTDYRYASWQPIQTEKTALGTKPPYYGNIFVAEMVRGGSNVQITNLPLSSSSTEGAYAAYVNGKLARIAVVNLVEYNYTSTDPATKRPSALYTFQVQSGTPSISVRRLIANGSDAITGITWDGYSYNYELDGGRPVRLDNVTINEKARVDRNGLVSIDIPYSSAAILTID
ncbi:Beta-glucuronidase [Talaromyces pinophilus]|nr:Beta-glucuronidase [Talaromyces pinophilus]